MPLARVEVPPSANHVSEVDLAVIVKCPQVMEEGNHHVASVAQEINYATICRTRKIVAFKMHRRPKAPIVTPIVNVRNKMINQIIRHIFRVEAVNDAGEKILHPGV